MEIRIASIGDKGILANERIGFNIMKDCQLKFYLVAKTRTSGIGFANSGDAFFWFVPQEVKENDKVVLYTKKGKNSIMENKDGTTTYFYYWGLTEAIFKTDIDRVVLAKMNTWKLD